MKRPPRAPRRVTVGGLDADGIGQATEDGGRVWRLKGGVPGQVLLVGGRPKHGTILDVESDHPDAIPPPCPLFGDCGGCLYQSLPLDRQREEKMRALQALLLPLGAEGRAVVPAGDGYHYRNKLELSFGTHRWLTRAQQAQSAAGENIEREGRFLGMHGGGRFDRIVDTPACAIADEAINEVVARLRADVLQSPFPCWAPREKEGFWRHAVFRKGAEGVLVLLYTSPGGDAEAAWLRAHAARWGAAGVLWYESERSSDAAHGTLRERVHGRPALTARLGGVDFPLSPNAFFQVSESGASALLGCVREALGTGGTLLDLYCGVGAFGLALHTSFDRIGGIELSEAAIDEARANAARLGVRACYRAGPVERELPALLEDLGLSGAVVGRLALLCDPPRNGLHPDALRTLSALPADVLVYVACKPSSLARDGAVLLDRGWRCTGWTAVDMFPHTAHIEVVARFERHPAAPGD